MTNKNYYVLSSVENEDNYLYFAKNLTKMLNEGWEIVPNTFLISAEYHRIVVLSRPNQVC
jgi:hypothetical protein